jgi:hypothetical protein
MSVDLTYKSTNFQQRAVSVSCIKSVAEADILSTAILWLLPKNILLTTTRVAVQYSSGTASATIKIFVDALEVAELPVDMAQYLVDMSNYIFPIGGQVTVTAGSTAPAAGDLIVDITMEYIEQQKTTGDITTTGTVSATTLTGPLSTAAQPNVTSLGTLTGLTVSGDADFSSNTLFIDDSTSRVGIGTNSPSVDVQVEFGTSNGIMSVRSSGTNTDGFFQIGNSDATRFLSIFGGHSGNLGTNLIFKNDAGSHFRIGTAASVTGSGYAEKIRLDVDGNLGIGVTSFGTSATGVLGLSADKVVPTTSPAGMVQIFADDSSDGSANATLAIRTEQAVEAIGTFTPSNKLKIWINGTEYWIQLEAV